jgi:hypothetical protein
MQKTGPKEKNTKTKKKEDDKLEKQTRRFEVLLLLVTGHCPFYCYRLAFFRS